MAPSSGTPAVRGRMVDKNAFLRMPEINQYFPIAY